MNENLQYYLDGYSQILTQLNSGSQHINTMATQVMQQMESLTTISDTRNSIRLTYYNEKGNAVGEHYLHMELLERMTEAMALFTFKSTIEKLINRKLQFKDPPK